MSFNFNFEKIHQNIIEIENLIPSKLKKIKIDTCEENDVKIYSDKYKEMDGDHIDKFLIKEIFPSELGGFDSDENICDDLLYTYENDNTEEIVKIEEDILDEENEEYEWIGRD